MPAGTIALTNNSATVTGSGTSFTTELKVGDFIGVIVGSAPYTAAVGAIASNTSLTLNAPFNGPTSSGLSWNAVPASLKIAITQQVLNDMGTIVRGMILEKANWQKIFSTAQSVTVTLPDLTTFTGPGWGYLASTAGNALQQRGRPTAFTDVNNIGPDANGLGIWNFQASVDYNMSNLPEIYPGVLEVFAAGNNAGTQRYTTARGTVYVRAPSATWNAASPAWNEWFMVSMATNSAVFSNDLNTLTSAGRYTISGSATNTPIAITGVLEVTRYAAGATTVQQLFKTVSGQAALLNRIFTRTLSGTTWSAWAESLTTNSVIPLNKGGTGATTAADARTNLGLGTAAVSDAQANNTDGTPGRLLINGAYGLGQSISNQLGGVPYNINQFWGAAAGASGAPNTERQAGVSLCYSGNSYAANLAVSLDTTTPKLWVRGMANGSAGTWLKVYTSGNTTTASDGTLKAASPVIRIAKSQEENQRADIAETGFEWYGCGTANEEAAGVSISRLDTGKYVVTGSAGLASEGWQLLPPRDPQGSGDLGIVEAEQTESGGLTISLYKRRYKLNDDGDIEVVKGELIDVPANSWIDVRLDMPADSAYNLKQGQMQQEAEQE